MHVFVFTAKNHLQFPRATQIQEADEIAQKRISWSKKTKKNTGRILCLCE